MQLRADPPVSSPARRAPHRRGRRSRRGPRRRPEVRAAPEATPPSLSRAPSSDCRASSSRHSPAPAARTAVLKSYLTSNIAVRSDRALAVALLTLRHCPAYAARAAKSANHSRELPSTTSVSTSLDHRARAILLTQAQPFLPRPSSRHKEGVRVVGTAQPQLQPRDAMYTHRPARGVNVGI